MGIGDYFAQLIPIKVTQCSACKSMQARLNGMTPDEVRMAWDEITLQISINASKTLYGAISSARIRKRLAGLLLAQAIRKYENN